MIGKTMIETPLLKNTHFAIVKGNELYTNPDGYNKEVKIITLPEEKDDIFFNLKTNLSIPDGFFGLGSVHGFNMYKLW